MIQRFVSPELRRITRFSLVGVLNTGVDLAAFYVLFSLVGLPLIAANLLAFLVALANSFVFNRFWTFGSRFSGSLLAGALRFCLGNLLGALLGTGALWALHALGFEVMAAKLLSIGVSMIWNYLFMRTFVFETVRPGAS